MRDGEKELIKLREVIADLEKLNNTAARSRQISVAITHAENAELWLERSLFARHETEED